MKESEKRHEKKKVCVCVSRVSVIVSLHRYWISQSFAGLSVIWSAEKGYRFTLKEERLNKRMDFVFVIFLVNLSDYVPKEMFDVKQK